ncbi:hypothetical protein [Psychrobium sp. 1_MG-2023]|uniref:hypothetical protein n=1 Tax=Psychrobium sp. 1_MG-2023 TaxID=3062624 RepID=UPI000C32EA6A|nr:hypothetical protein [Psychrobium sp. 1_MG-2023]MDP2561633.1 hypothetical protein [Psychrobium sp. 1_MG-2023]PKF55650.1 hypothetical protein CW748_12395 [Alteromonadales bacterium alter-6D02]
MGIPRGFKPIDYNRDSKVRITTYRNKIFEGVAQDIIVIDGQEITEITGHDDAQRVALVEIK